MTARGWLVLAATVLAAALTARLGFWQLDRAGQKLQLQAAIDAQADRAVLGNAELGEGQTGAIRQNLDPVAFGRESGLALLSFTVVQTDAGADDGLLRHWPAPDFGLHKHYGYAFQWFALCALILILYVWFQLVRPRLRTRRPA